MTASEYCPGHPGSPAPSGDASDLRRVECDRCFLDYVHETVGTEGVPTRDDLARLFSLAAKAERLSAAEAAITLVRAQAKEYAAHPDALYHGEYVARGLISVLGKEDES